MHKNAIKHITRPHSHSHTKTLPTHPTSTPTHAPRAQFLATQRPTCSVQEQLHRNCFHRDNGHSPVTGAGLLLAISTNLAVYAKLCSLRRFPLLDPVGALVVGGLGRGRWIRNSSTQIRPLMCPHTEIQRQRHRVKETQTCTKNKSTHKNTHKRTDKSTKPRSLMMASYRHAAEEARLSP